MIDTVLMKEVISAQFSWTILTNLRFREKDDVFNHSLHKSSNADHREQALPSK